MELRIEESKDACLLATINETAQNLHVREYPEYFKQFDFEAVKAAMMDVLEKEGWHAFVAYMDEDPVGYVLFYERLYEENPFRFAYKGIHVDQIAVLEAYQRMSIGSALMGKVEDYAHEISATQIELTFWDNNNHAKQFYAKKGFVNKMHFVVKQLNP